MLRTFSFVKSFLENIPEALQDTMDTVKNSITKSTYPNTHLIGQPDDALFYTTQFLDEKSLSRLRTTCTFLNTSKIVINASNAFKASGICHVDISEQTIYYLVNDKPRAKRRD